MVSSKRGISRREIVEVDGRWHELEPPLVPSMAYAQSVPESGTLRFQIESGPGTDFVAVVDAFIEEHPEIDVEFSQIEAMVVGIEWQRNAMEAGTVDLISNENPEVPQA